MFDLWFGMIFCVLSIFFNYFDEEERELVALL